MSVVIHGLYCPACDETVPPSPVDIESLPDCVCGTPMRTDYSHGKAATTDVHGIERVSMVHDDEHGQPLRYSSTRDLEQKMKRLHPGYECIGDKVGGARPEHGIKGTVFSGAGMGAGASSSASK